MSCAPPFRFTLVAGAQPVAVFALQLTRTYESHLLRAQDPRDVFQVIERSAQPRRHRVKQRSLRAACPIRGLTPAAENEAAC